MPCRGKEKMDTELDELKTLNDAELKRQIAEDAQRITDQTPLDEDAWDDPEDWQIEAVRLAHATIEWLKRETYDGKIPDDVSAILKKSGIKL